MGQTFDLYNADLPDDPDPQPGADGRKQNDQAPLVGELQYVPHPRRAYRRNSSGQRDYDEAFISEVIAARVTDPRRGLRSIADEFGVSVESVRRWTTAAADKRQFADVPKLRGEASLRLQVAIDEAWAIYRAAVATRKLRYALDALHMINMFTATDAKLMGMNMPVKLDVAVQQQLTEAELELQEIIREAQAKTAADEAAVIAQASQDPDL